MNDCHCHILTASIALLLAASAAAAPISYSTAGANYTQNFDGLPSTGTFTFSGVGPFELSAAPVSAAGLDGWNILKTGGSNANALFAVGTGSGGSGSAFSFGVAGVGPVTDRALGALASGTTVMSFGATFVNNTPATLTTFTLSYTGEQWRKTTAVTQNSLAFSYATSGTAIDLATGTFNPAPALNFSAPIFGTAAGSDLQVDGNDTPNRAAVSSTITIPGGWAPGATLVLRWSDTNDGGNDQALAIDDLTFSAQATVIRNLLWAALGGTGNWDTTTANWSGDSTTFGNGDIVTFGDGAQGEVTIQAGGVQPATTNVTHTTGTYTFKNTTGDTVGISGAGPLLKSGAGTLALTSPNTYTGGTTVSGGVLQVSDNNQLGTGGLSIGGATLRFGAATTLTRAVTINATGATVDTAGFDAAIAGSLTGTGNFTKTGLGTLDVNSVAGYTGETAIAAGVLRVTAGTGTSNMRVAAAGGTFVGDFVMASSFNAYFNSGKISGGGVLKTEVSGAVIANNGTASTVTIDNDIELNALGLPTTYNATIGAGNGNTLIINGEISGASEVRFASFFNGGGGGVVQLNKAATYTGTTVVRSGAAGVVRLGLDDALPTGSGLSFGTGALNVGALDLAGFDQTVFSLASGTTGTVNGITNTGATPSRLTITGDLATTFSGPIGIPADLTNLTGATNNLALTLEASHTGTLTLTGASTYTGGTDVSGGELRVNGSIVGLTTVGSLATLSGSGTVGTVVLEDGGSLAPGAGGIGTLTGTAFTWDAGGTLLMELGATGVSDTFNIGTGVLTKVGFGSWVFDFQGGGQQDSTYTLLRFGSLASGSEFAVGDFSYVNLAPGVSGTFVLTPSELTFVTVPEPGALGNLLLGTAALLGGIRVRRRRPSELPRRAGEL